MVLAPVEVIAYHYEWGVQVLATAFALVYFHLSDTTSGQTIGKSLFKLRTVTLDGGIVGGRQAAARTVLRLIDHTIVGFLVMVCTGERRQRLGDLAARTCVVDAREVVVSRPFDRSMLAYPLAWLAPALLVFTLTVMGRFPGSYRVVADTVCEEADARVPNVPDPQGLLELIRTETAALEAIDAPPHWRDRHAVLVTEYESMTFRLEQALVRTVRSRSPQKRWRREWLRLVHQAESANRRLATLGYEGCAGAAGDAT
jgi:hypothetical protein